MFDALYKLFTGRNREEAAMDFGRGYLRGALLLNHDWLPWFEGKKKVLSPSEIDSISLSGPSLEQFRDMISPEADPVRYFAHNIDACELAVRRRYGAKHAITVRKHVVELMTSQIGFRG